MLADRFECTKTVTYASLETESRMAGKSGIYFYFATMARIMSPAFSAWSAMDPMMSARRIK